MMLVPVPIKNFSPNMTPNGFLLVYQGLAAFWFSIMARSKVDSTAVTQAKQKR